MKGDLISDGEVAQKKAQMESPTEHFEHAEHAEHAAHSGDRRLVLVSITIAIIAVVAATVSSLESMETAATIGAKNEAVLAQSKASDRWSYYQAKSVKENIYSAMAEIGNEKAASLRDKAARYADEKKQIEQDARHLEEKTEAANVSAEVHERRHHILTLAVTLLHISIAIATIAIILRGMLWPWRTAVGLSAAGAAIAAYAYLT
jgi:glucan-binding YG repeat protein